MLWLAACAAMKTWQGTLGTPYVRAVLRVSILAAPVLWNWHLFKDQRDPLLLKRNWRNGVIVGLTVAIVWFVPICIFRFWQGRYVWQTPMDGAIWLNWIVGSPAGEEVLFRALLQQQAERLYGAVTAVLLSSLAFGLFHLPQWVLLSDQSGRETLSATVVIVIYGLVFGALFQWTRSIWGSLIPHILNNLVATSVVALRT